MDPATPADRITSPLPESELRESELQRGCRRARRGYRRVARMSSWLTPARRTRLIAAGFIVAWAAALEWNMREIRTQLQEQQGSDQPPANPWYWWSVQLKSGTPEPATDEGERAEG